MADLINALVIASERAACIARACCSDSNKESLFVVEKAEGEANARFYKDFKTIADVLAQESAKTEISALIPELSYKVRGEECSEIGGVNIAVQESVERTSELLNYLVTPNAATRMAEAVHSKIDLKLNLPDDIPVINPSEVGVWIDPIDATAEFIAGAQGTADAGSGLPCVTVLIGAYLRSTGEPVVGVINQPFFDNGRGRIIWGICYNGVNKYSTMVDIPEVNSKSILMSAAEKLEVVENIKSLGWQVESVPGAGHKLLKVALGEAAAYIVSQGTTFRWDTCAPHAILRAKGGDVINYTTKTPITYNNPEDSHTKEYCNSGGVIAFADQSVYEKMANIFHWFWQPEFEALINIFSMPVRDVLNTWYNEHIL